MISAKDAPELAANPDDEGSNANRHYHSRFCLRYKNLPAEQDLKEDPVREKSQYEYCQSIRREPAKGLRLSAATLSGIRQP